MSAGPAGPEVPARTLLEAAEPVREAAARRAAAADRDRILDPEVIRALKDAGFPAHFVPRRFGGASGTFTAFLDAAALVAEGCAAAGWCAALFATHARLAAYLPVEAQRELWAQGPDTLVSAGFVPSGTVSAAAGGWTLSGSWSYISGVDFADWALLAAWEPDPAERRLRFFAVPRRDFTVRDTWFTTGLRGTGSRTVELDGVHVPAHRTVAQAVLLAGRAPDTPPARCHDVPFRLVNGIALVAPALGAARHALHAWTEWIAGKTEVLMGRTVAAADKGSVQSALARTSAALDAAGLLLRRIAADADADAPPDPGAVPRSHRDYAVVAESLRDAVDRLQRASGAGGQAEGGPVERAWRDVHAAASHAALQFDANAAVYARHALAC
ncbi:acyl-CoA dehydrogenase family protein [Streptomyces sp. HD]|uniref:acyl-CoA dehydrogenase family protein n=1 Tax=Streptomyces sp. HD TaxID=3020892 RepID=UPI00232DFA2C|nr:acyl-CoA dehydrogenase family protein [Streptomyces sp. HD]MDC0772587.1 acyl-CoA dehydrogenase family protein [Streptomyces sp. HD]